MPARFHVAEEVARSPFGVQTRQDLDSSPGAVDLTDVMTVENKSLLFEPLFDALDAGLRVLRQHATDQLAIVMFGLRGQGGHGTL